MRKINEERNEKITLKKEIGRKMRQFRKHLHLTQSDMAPHCGIGRADLSRIEKGEVFPGIFLLTNLVKKFNLSLLWILLNEGEMLISEEECIKKKNSIVICGEELKNLFIYIEKSPLLKHRILALFYETLGLLDNIDKNDKTNM
ncbi:MAG: helix-turn-helix domain-containing protein [Acidobacteria bacterium]|jgi:DNA-binding XRE family transcriptional regulator|nr:helix-turn-helix domain-containing protein [Acidobacteriota bacterium]